VTTDIIIYHNPECGTSRNALAMIRNAGIEPHVVEYLKTPPSRPLLESLIARAGITPRALLREKGTPLPSWAGQSRSHRRAAHRCHDGAPHPHQPPAGGFAAGRQEAVPPSEEVLDLIPAEQRGAFAKEDGEQVVDARQADHGGLNGMASPSGRPRCRRAARLRPSMPIMSCMAPRP
jgi:arsenate reductase